MICFEVLVRCPVNGAMSAKPSHMFEVGFRRVLSESLGSVWPVCANIRIV